MRLLRFLIGTSGRQATVAIGAGIAGGACNAALLAWLNQALTSVNRPAAWMFLGLVALRLGTSYAARQSLARVSAGTLHVLRMDLARRIVATPLRQLESLGSQRLLAVLTEDVSAIGAALAAVPALAVSLAVLAGGAAYLCWLSAPLCLMLLAVVGLGLVVYRLLSSNANAALRSARRAQDSLFDLLKALTGASAEIKRHDGRRRAFLGALRGASAALEQHNLTATGRFGLAHGWSQAIVYLAIGTVVLGWVPVETDQRVLTGFVLTIVYLTGPLASVILTQPAISRADVAMQRIEDAGLALACDPPDEAIRTASPDWRRIELVDITLTYRAPDESFTLGPVSLSIGRGEVVFLTGGNGSGKSTLARVLTGLYEPDSGIIRIDDGVPEDASTVLRQIATGVLPDFFLFDSLLGLTDPDVDARATALLQSLNLAHKVAVRNGELTTTKLSHGQRKRLALLVAQLERRSLMVLDEWAADQDAESKAWFYREWLPAFRASGQSAVVVTHDDRYFHVADRIIRLEDGRPVGPPAPATHPAPGALAMPGTARV